MYTYAYDDEGNRVSRTKSGESTTYAWDYRNRLSSVAIVTSGGTRVVQYKYDPLDRLLSRTETLNAVVQSTERFVHDGDQIILAFNGSNQLTHRYLWSPQAVDQLLADEQVTAASMPLTSAGTVYWALGDQLGSVRDVINNSGTVVGHVSYDGFGRVLAATGTLQLPFRYTGKMLDGATGLQWNLHRWYDASVGRWVSEDPATEEVNQYRYVTNATLSNADPLGLWKQYMGESTKWQAEPGDTFKKLFTEIERKHGKLNHNLMYAIRPLRPPGFEIIGVGPELSWLAEFNSFANINEKEYEAKWNAGGPLPCGVYDTSYLTTEHKSGGSLRVSVGTDTATNNYISVATKFFDADNVVSGDAALRALKNASNFGQTPVSQFWVVGHGAAGAKEMGAIDFSDTLSINDFKDERGITSPFHFLKFNEAAKRHLSWGFYFDQSAEVRFIGCRTNAFADSFSKGLWSGATVYGTRQYTYADSVMGMGFYKVENGSATMLPDFYKTPEEYFKSNQWSAHKGQK